MIFLGLVGLVPWLVSPENARAEDPAGESVECRFFSGPMVGQFMLPNQFRRLEGETHSTEVKFVGSDSGTLTICGKEFQAVVKPIGRGYAVGIDGDRSGEIERNEFSPLRQRGDSVSCKIKLTDNPGPPQHDLILSEIHFDQTSQGVILNVRMQPKPAWCMQASVDRILVRLLDMNLDGEYRQDGSDAIVLGKSMCAVPLWRRHMLGADLVELQVSSDGSELITAKVTDVNLAKVTHHYPRNLIKALVLTDDSTQAFDLIQTGPDGIPPGDYKIAYALLSLGRDYAEMIAPGTAYGIKPEVTNQLNLGAPFQLYFRGELGGTGKIRIPPAFDILGMGGEEYRVVSQSRFGRPKLAFLVGGKPVQSASFDYG
jgi:hypothetical protein